MKIGPTEGEECMISKSLLLPYLKSNTVIIIIGIVGSSHICELILKNVLPHENYDLFCKQKGFLHFDKYSNIPHEGKNTGLKYYSTAVLPCHAILE